MKISFGLQLAGKIMIQLVLWSVLVVLIGKMVGLM